MRRKKRTLAAITLAAGLLVSPLPLLEGAGLGTETAFARECRVEVTVCQEVNLVFWKYETCYTFRAFCD